MNEKVTKFISIPWDMRFADHIECEPICKITLLYTFEFWTFESSFPDGKNIQGRFPPYEMPKVAREFT